MGHASQQAQTQSMDASVERKSVSVALPITLANSIERAWYAA